MSWVAIDFETANETRASACALGVAIVEADHVVERASWLSGHQRSISTLTTS